MLAEDPVSAKPCHRAQYAGRTHRGQRLRRSRRPHEPLLQGRQGRRLDQEQEVRHLLLLCPRIYRIQLRLTESTSIEKGTVQSHIY